MVPNGYTSKRPGPYWSNPSFLKIFDTRALWRSVLSARAPECQKFRKNDGLDQYGPGRFGRLILLQSEKCGTERVNYMLPLNGRSRSHNLFRQVLKISQNFRRFRRKLWRHLVI